MQTINFYLDSYRPKPLSFDSRFVLLSVCLAFIGLLAIGWLQASEVNDLEARLKQRKLQLEQQQQQLASITNQLRTKTNQAELETELATKQKELNRFRKIISLVNLPLTHTPVNFSQILIDLSEKTIDKLWLTKIQISSNDLSLNGTTTNAEIIPSYVDTINQAESLKRHFDELKIDRVNDENLINFELLNGRLLNE